MADVHAAAPADEDEEARRMREEEEALDRLLLEQEQQQLLQEEQEANNNNDDDVRRGNDNNHEPQQQEQVAEDVDGDGALFVGGQNDEILGENNDNDDPHDHEQHQQQEQQQSQFTKRRGKISYTAGSFGAALGLIWYALRTRQQYYLAMVFLTSSKWAYIVLGNAIIASCVATFRSTIGLFLNGLRPIEAEGLGDFFRWNVTETCLALTMFRSEMNVKTGILFLILVLCKCIHWCAETRRSHLTMTEEAVNVVIATDEDGNATSFWNGWPMLQRNYMGVMTLLHVCLVVDVIAIAQCAQDIVDNGPSVAMFFGFEYSILFVTAMSNILLGHLHFVDGMIHWAHEHSSPERLWHALAHRSLHVWKDHKATLNFAVEVQAQAARFLFYIIFFGIVLTYYGMPINLFREVYMSFQSLKTRLSAFAKYRRLMRNMNRFDSVESEEELEEAGRTCIICRDSMTLIDCKKLPGCGHVFHKSCLREWLVQQQTCPTCRGDIQASQARLRNLAGAGVGPAAVMELEGQLPPDQQEDNGGGDGGVQAPPPREQDDGANQQTDGNVNQNRDLPPVQTPANDNNVPPTTSAAVAAATRDKSIQPTARTIKAPTTAFPCLYRVKDAEGVAVWSDTTKSTTSQEESGIERIIPCNTLVLCTKLEWKQFDDLYSGMMLQIPNNGWIREDSLERLVLDLPIAKKKQ